MSSGGLRIGHGVDAHQLIEGRPLMLGGIRIPHSHGLEGHSDGDVATHALCQAILGAANAGDMGKHFPSSDERWRDVPSSTLLSRVIELATEQGLTLQSAQVVIIATEPRLSGHLSAMAARLADVAGTVPGSIAVGVTSTDGMGFTGRSEGIAASAVVLLAPIS